MMRTFTPERDATLGLIFRLNNLWDRVDTRALSGDNDRWELAIDRIFSNLLYREELDIEEDGDGKVTDVKLSEKDIEVALFVKNKIRLAKREIFTALKERDPKKLEAAKMNHYNAVLLYEISMRKFMQSLGLYLKEIDSNPSKAMFGR